MMMKMVLFYKFRETTKAARTLTSDAPLWR